MSGERAWANGEGSGARGFAAFLGASLGLVERQQPGFYAGLCRALEGLRLGVEVDGERSWVGLVGGRVGVLPRGEGAVDVEVRATRGAVLELLDGRHTLLSAVLAERLWLRGRPDALLGFDDALGAYLHGAVRAPGMPALLRAYREGPRARVVFRDEGRATCGRRSG